MSFLLQLSSTAVSSFVLILGALYESTHEWKSVFYFVSATMITAGILMIFTAVVSSYLSKRRNQANQVVEDT